MNVSLATPWTRERFLTWEERQETRHEFDGAQPRAMTGGTAAHAAIQRNLAIAIGGRLRGKPCRFKLREYQATPSIHRTVILEQDFPAATVIERRGEDWTVHTLTDGDLLRLPEAELEFPLIQLYEGIDLTEPVTTP